MCHGCVYTGSFELDYLRTLLASLHVHRIETYLPTYPSTHKTKQNYNQQQEKKEEETREKQQEEGKMNGTCILNS